MPVRGIGMSEDITQKQLTRSEILRLMHEERYADIIADFEDSPVADIAEMVRNLPDEDQADLLTRLPLDMATEIFEYLDVDGQKALILSLTQNKLAEIFNNMEPDNRTSLLSGLPPEANRRLLSFLRPQERALAQSLLNYPKHTIGRLVTSNFMAVSETTTVEQLLLHIRRSGEDKETLDHMYVIDRAGKLLDDIDIKEILVANPETPMGELMDRRFTPLVAHEDQEEAVRAFKRYDVTSLPVVDDEGLLIGIVTVDDILDVSEKENTEDMHKMGGMETLDSPYLQTSLGSMLFKRGVWLVILFLGAMFTPTIMGFYENAIAQAVFLALFIPLIISSGGNSGAQAATLITRALALDEIRMRHWKRVFRRELASGLLLGGILGLMGFLRVVVGAEFGGGFGPNPGLVAMAVGITLVGIVLWGTLIGSMLPFVLKRVGIDPATCSAPFVATIIDLTGIVIFFHISLLFLRDLTL